MVRELNIEGVTELDVKKKINSVRTRYKYELNEVKAAEKSGAGVNDLYRLQLEWFPLADAFLRAVSKSTRSRSNLEVSPVVEAFRMIGRQSRRRTEESVGRKAQSASQIILRCKATASVVMKR